jgi:tellurite methyltransferase
VQPESRAPDESRGGPDRRRWDAKYAAERGPLPEEPSPLLVAQRDLLSGGRALEVACGTGRQALYLAARGYLVDGLDISAAGLSQAREEAQRRGLRLRLVQVDLARWWFPSCTYDLIVVFFYLNRRLMPALAAALQPGGLLIQAQHNIRILDERPGFNPAYLVQPGELVRLAQQVGLEVLREGDRAGEGDHVSYVVARRPSPTRATRRQPRAGPVSQALTKR